MKHALNLVLVVLGFSLLTTPARAQQPRNLEEQKVDASIVRALTYLANSQNPNGSWKAQGRDSTAATSLAVMAFLSAGHVPGEGPYGPLINRGIFWVIQQQQANGLLVERANGHGLMYSHGISTLMMAEVAGMVGRQEARQVRTALEKAIKVILLSQNVRKPARDRGGWRYNANSRDSDLSVTGWQLLALRAAKDIGCDVPADNIDDAVRYVKMCSSRSGFGYTANGGSTTTMTGTGITALEVCGQHLAPESVAGGRRLLTRPIQRHDSFFYYGAYYTSVGMFKMGGKYWEGTRSHMNRLLLSLQLPDGSWQGVGGERTAGPVYCTSMSVLAMAVEYRYLPIYQR